MPFTPLMALQQEFYNFSHRAMYDYDTLALFLETIGFDKVEASSYGESRLEPCPDSEWRVGDSFYTEAVAGEPPIETGRRVTEGSVVSRKWDAERPGLV